jgi:hypothetical protein
MRVHKQDLPSDLLINEVISSLIQLDSLDQGKLGSQNLHVTYIYSRPKWNVDSLRSILGDNPIPPPPQVISPHPFSMSYSLSFDEVFTYFDYSKKSGQRQNIILP